MIPGIGIGVGFYPEAYSAGGWNPYVLANLAARYDLSNTSSYITATGVKLLGDLSGNSNVNVLCLNGVAGNYASAPNAAPVQITGDIDIRIRAALSVWDPASEGTLFSKYTSSGNERGWAINITPSKTLKLYWSNNGTGVLTATSSVAVSVSNLSDIWVRATLLVNNGSGGWSVTFYTSSDGLSWTQLGTTQTGAGTTSIFNNTAAVLVGGVDGGASATISGIYYRAQIYNGIAGALVFDANFATAPKLASTFTESSVNAATVTINTSGDHGARICGARDQVEMTAARQPTVSGNTLSFSSAASQHMDCAKFAFGQPNTIFMVGSLTTWASGTYMLDGDTANTLGLVCTTGTPKMSMNAGSNAAENSNLTVGQRSIFMLQFNGASSSFQINATTATTGNPGAGTPNGITIGALGSVANFADMNMNELIAYTGAMDGATIAQVRAYLAAKWSVTL